MKEVLRALNTVAGIKGSMVVTLDGIVAAAELGKGLNEETVAAISSRFLMATQEHANTLGLKDFSRLILEGTHGKIVLVPAGKAFLVVIADMRMDMDASFIEIVSAARRIEGFVKIPLGATPRRGPARPPA